MAKKDFLVRYSLELKRLRQGHATFKEICDYLEHQTAFTDEVIGFSKRTFQRDLKDIRALYNIDILYDRKNRSYFIDSLGRTETTDRMLEAFEIFNALNLTDDLSQFIQFEKRKPHGTHHFHGLLHCIKNHFVVKFLY